MANQSLQKELLFSGNECEILLKAFKDGNENPSAEAIVELAEQFHKKTAQIKKFFMFRRRDLRKRKEQISDLYVDQLHKVELTILERRHAEDIEATAEEIEKLEELMDVKKGTYNFFFDCYAEPKKSEKKVKESAEEEAKKSDKEVKKSREEEAKKSDKEVKKSREEEAKKSEKEVKKSGEEESKKVEKVVKKSEKKGQKNGKEGNMPIGKEQESKSKEENEKPIAKERESLSHFVKPKSGWLKYKTSKALPKSGSPEDTAENKENLETPDLIRRILLNQCNQESLPGFSLETFELHYLLNKMYVFVKLAGSSNRTARWVFAKEAPEKMRFEDGTTMKIGKEQVEERRKSAFITYAISPNPLSAAHEFILLLSRFFSTELHKVIAAQPNNTDFHVVLNWPEVQKCEDVDILVNNGMTNNEFVPLVRMFWTCPRLTITAARANDLCLPVRFPGVLNVCLLSPCHFHRFQLLELNWNNFHVEVPKENKPEYDFGPVEINEFFLVWMRRIKSNVDSVRFALPCVEHANALQGLEKHGFKGNIRENKELFNSAHGFLRDNNWVSIIDITNKGGVHASIYSSDEFLDFVVWTPKK